MSPPRQSDDRALVLLDPGSILHEVLLAVDLLRDALTLEYATPTEARDATGLRRLPDLPCHRGQAGPEDAPERTR